MSVSLRSAKGRPSQVGRHAQRAGAEPVAPTPYGSRCLPVWLRMSTGSFASDEELLARLQAPPDLCDGVESLAYWRTRLGRLPRYRRRARREAARMILAWERRVLAALVAERGAPLWVRVRAARLVAAGPLRRWARRAAFVLGAATLVVLTAGLLTLELLISSL
jgi:ribosomal protein L39E